MRDTGFKSKYSRDLRKQKSHTKSNHHEDVKSYKKSDHKSVHSHVRSTRPLSVDKPQDDEDQQQFFEGEGEVPELVTKPFVPPAVVRAKTIRELEDHDRREQNRNPKNYYHGKQ